MLAIKSPYLAPYPTPETPAADAPLQERVAAVLAGVFETSADEITPAAVVRELPNADSARILESIVVLEEHFGVRLPDEHIFRVETVDDLIALIARASAAEEA
jgi:acyl carrier protein